MGKTEILMVAILICLALLLGVLFGGTSVWYLKPEGKDKIVDRVVNKFVCSDGAVKGSQSECPIIDTSSGQTKVVCPACDCNSSDFVYRRCDCNACTAQCGIKGGGVTTTTIGQMTCKTCSTDIDCGSPYYDQQRCNKDKMYKMYNEPFCQDGCCKVKQTRNDIRSCLENERCVPAEGCVPYEESE